MIICVGEILLDCYINSVNEEIKITAYPGGAPYNISCNLNYLGNDVSFIGTVGKDEFGNELINHVQKQAFKYPQISQQKNYNTRNPGCRYFFLAVRKSILLKNTEKGLLQGVR